MLRIDKLFTLSFFILRFVRVLNILVRTIIYFNLRELKSVQY